MNPNANEAQHRMLSISSTTSITGYSTIMSGSGFFGPKKKRKSNHGTAAHMPASRLRHPILAKPFGWKKEVTEAFTYVDKEASASASKATRSSKGEEVKYIVYNCNVENRHGNKCDHPTPMQVGKGMGNAFKHTLLHINQDEDIDTRSIPIYLVVVDDYKHGIPRVCIHTFLDTIRVDNYSDAIHYLDFNLVDRSIQAMPREEVAKLLKLVLDRSLWIDLPALSNDQAGFVDDGLSGNRDLVGYIPLKDQRIPFYVQRIAREDGVLIWKIAGISINYIPKLYTQYGDGPIGEILTQFIPHKSILGLQLWQWITFFGLIIAARDLVAPFG